MQATWNWLLIWLSSRWITRMVYYRAKAWPSCLTFYRKPTYVPKITLVDHKRLDDEFTWGSCSCLYMFKPNGVMFGNFLAPMADGQHDDDAEEWLQELLDYNRKACGTSEPSWTSLCNCIVYIYMTCIMKQYLVWYFLNNSMVFAWSGHCQTSGKAYRDLPRPDSCDKLVWVPMLISWKQRPPNHQELESHTGQLPWMLQHWNLQGRRSVFNSLSQNHGWTTSCPKPWMWLLGPFSNIAMKLWTTLWRNTNHAFSR